MKQILLFLSLFLFAHLSYAQPYLGGRLQNTRLNVSIGSFSVGGIGDYQGAVGVAGSTGYTTSNIAVGDVLVDDANIYLINAVTPIVAGSSATLQLTYLQGTVGSQAPPQSGKGFICKPSSFLGLLLLTQNGSNFITEEQEAKALTHNFLVIDSMLFLLQTDTSLQSFNLTIPEERTVSADIVAGRKMIWNNLEQIFISDSFLVTTDTLKLNGVNSQLSGSNKLFVKTPRVNGSTAFSNWFLKLINPVTGEAEYDDINKYVVAADTDSIYFNNGSETVLINRLDTIFAPTGTSIVKYNAGNGCWVTASGTGITYTKSPGSGLLTIPIDVEILSYRIVGASGDLSGGELTITVDYDDSVLYNQANATLYHPSITIQNRTQVLNTDPYQQRPDDAGDSIDIFDEIFSTASQVSTKITGLAGDFGIKAQF